MRINKTIRQDIIDIISLSKGGWYGELSDVAFLERIFDLDNLPSYDARFTTARDDIYQHRINNIDWEDDWVFRDNRFNILGTDDNTFFRFICEVIHPRVRSNQDQVQQLLEAFNQQLSHAGYELVERARISGQPVFEARRLRSLAASETRDHTINFYTVAWRKNINFSDELPADANYPCAVLMTDSWDDYGYKTYFELSYIDEQRTQLFSKGVKILHRGEEITQLPDRFTALSNEFCSLGQSQEFYLSIKDLGKTIYTKILTSLNDVVFNPDIGKTFETVNGFQTSLLRFSEAEKAYHEASSLFLDDKVRSRSFKFQFSTTVSGAEAPHLINFDFSPDQTELHRISAIIGKNGTGKTQVLANFAQAMSGLKTNTDKFSPSRPSFSKVIALSYSVFDEFEKPPEGKDTFSYKYCGIKTKNDSLNETELSQLKLFFGNYSGHGLN